MGYIKHDAIIVTGFRKEEVERGRSKAAKLGLPASEVIDSNTNGYYSFLIGPDGSKSGWEEDVAGEEARAAWISWSRKKKLYLDWIHVTYGGDDDFIYIKDAGD